LGEGTFANVFKVKRKKDQKEYALKKVKMGKLAKKGNFKI
jgi:NIMA (never in mitosis gene a)-related kinase